MAEQEDEEQCQACTHWINRKEGSTACFPRTITYIMAPINETAMPAHKATFGDCPYRLVCQLVFEKGLAIH